MGDVLGCDLSMGGVDIEAIEDGAHRRVRIANREAAIKAFVEQLPPGCVVGMEATGQMHELLADVLHARGHTVYVVNPRWVHMYAKAIGARGKTDRGDA